MQFKVIFAFVLMGACLVQVTSANPASHDLHKGIIDDLIEKAERAIEKLSDLVHEKISEALKSLEQLQHEAEEAVANAIEAVKKQLEEIIAKAKQSIQDIIDKAEDMGIDISECTKDNEDEFQALFEKFLADEVHCVTAELDEVMRIITEAVQLLQDAYDAVSNLPQELKNCSKNSQPLICVNNVIANVAKLEKDLPAQIAKKVQEVSKFVSGLKARLEICATTQLANAGIAAAGIVADVAKCAMDKGVEQGR